MEEYHDTGICVAMKIYGIWKYVSMYISMIGMVIQHKCFEVLYVSLASPITCYASEFPFLLFQRLLPSKSPRVGINMFTFIAWHPTAFRRQYIHGGRNAKPPELLPAWHKGYFDDSANARHLQCEMMVGVMENHRLGALPPNLSECSAYIAPYKHV